MSGQVRCGVCVCGDVRSRRADDERVRAGAGTDADRRIPGVPQGARATSYAEVLPFMEAKGRAMIESIPEKPRAGMFDMLKKFEATYSEVAVTKEAITGETAVLSLSGKDPKGQAATGSVPMTKEASGWKVGTEKWSSKPK
jgi:hypothetical protein